MNKKNTMDMKSRLINHRHYEKLHSLCVKEENTGNIRTVTEAGYSALLSDEDRNDARKYFLYAAQAGSAEAMYKLGQCFEYGIGAEETDEAQALDWYKKAAKAGSAEAMTALAEHYIKCAVLDCVDYEKAFEQYMNAALAGDSGAQFQTALLYEYGMGVQANPQEAFAWCERAADGGNILAEYTLGRYYENGIGTDANAGAALSCYKKAAAAKNPQAQLALHRHDPNKEISKTAAALENAYNTAYEELCKKYGKEKTDKSREEAISGDGTACIIQGILLDSVRHQSVYAQQLAFGFFRKAALCGYSEAQWYAADYYMTGRFVKRNADEALRLFEASARNGYAPSLFCVGLCHEYGFAAEKDFDKAQELYRQAAEGGFAPAAAALLAICETENPQSRDCEKIRNVYSKLKSENAGIQPSVELFNYFPGNIQSMEMLQRYRVIRFEELRTGISERYFGRYKRLSDEGCACAQFRISDIYEKSIELPNSAEKAFKACLKAADDGYRLAVDRLKSYYEETPVIAAKYHEAQETEEDAEKAFSLYRRAAERGDTYSMQRLQKLYSKGDGTEQDEYEAYKWGCRCRAAGVSKKYVAQGSHWRYPKVADEDRCAVYYAEHISETESAYYLGVCCETGYGVARNPQKAFVLYREAVKRDYKWAHYALGRCYEKGCGTEINIQAAAEHYLVALLENDMYAIRHCSARLQEYKAEAEKGSQAMQCIVGMCIEKGWGTVSDETAAYELYNAAASRGYASALYLAGRCSEYGVGTKHDPEKAFDLYMQAAKQHSKAAVCAIGNCFERGIFVRRDSDSAQLWYRAAADSGYSYAAYRLGKMLLKTDLTQAKKYLLLAASCDNAKAQTEAAKIFESEGDTENALHWYERAAENENWEAHFALYKYFMSLHTDKADEKAYQHLLAAANAYAPEPKLELAECYAYGRLTEKDPEKAFKWYSVAANSGSIAAQYMLGSCFERGLGTAVNYEQALMHYEAAAKEGNAEAQYALGVCYAKGKGTEKNMPMAVYWYKCALEKESDKAATALGICYENGQGGLPVDMNRAFELYEKAAEKGNFIAQYRLGLCYEKGRPVPVDAKKAVEYYIKSADAGNKMAQMRLGECYENGFGVEKNQKAAVELYIKAANGNMSEAAQKLGTCYEYGYGVEKNPQIAASWYKKASRMSNKSAYKNAISGNSGKRSRSYNHNTEKKYEF